MRRRLAGMGVLALMAYSAAPLAQEAEAWLLLSRDSQHEVAKVVGDRLQTLLSLGNQPTWGESDQAIAFASYKSTVGGWVLEILDKNTEQLVSSHPLSRHLISDTSGPMRDLVLTHDYAYFITVLYAADLSGLTRNEVGGVFNLNRLSLANNELTSLPLPKGCINPRLIELKGSPVVYAMPLREQSTLATPEAIAKTWHVNLPQSAVPYSLFPISNDTVLYVDRDPPAVMKASKAGTSTLWKVPGSFADLYEARIVWLKQHTPQDPFVLATDAAKARCAITQAGPAR